MSFILDKSSRQLHGSHPTLNNRFVGFDHVWVQAFQGSAVKSNMDQVFFFVKGNLYPENWTDFMKYL